jgi:hypothetical protein
MTLNLGKRVDQLEGFEPAAAFRRVILRGTGAEIERERDRILTQVKPGDNIIFRIVVPFDGIA